MRNEISEKESSEASRASDAENHLPNDTNTSATEVNIISNNSNDISTAPKVHLKLTKII